MVDRTSRNAHQSPRPAPVNARTHRCEAFGPLPRVPQTGSGATTREAAHSAAARLLRNQGLSRTTVRRIAAAADTDPALVIRHFKSGEPLFLEAVHPTIDDEPTARRAAGTPGGSTRRTPRRPRRFRAGVFPAPVHGGDEAAESPCSAGPDVLRARAGGAAVYAPRHSRTEGVTQATVTCCPIGQF
ncbi:helix-turn-helix domain-containing protein [Streptomyces sp. XY152]|uniref:helix-turn-helix domain-containing protein n=1 Tax=Streptomyces sp. XY152 TaxID=1415560 RepID=UPI000D149D73|nr:helix-turn-helix domain-containing protein [Streptomyces sp. XY152]